MAGDDDVSRRFDAGRGEGPARDRIAIDRATWIGLALAAATMASRAAVRARDLTTWDAGLFAMGVLDYDVLAGQPHPPGYPLTILSGKAVHAVGVDAATAMVWVSILATGVAAFLVHRIGRTLSGPWTGALAAGLFALSPLAAFNGSIGLSYGAEAATSAALALLAWRAGQRPTGWRLVAVGAMLAVAMGVRPSALFFLAPLAAWAAVMPEASMTVRAGRLALVGGTAIVATLAWMLPAYHVGGGVREVLAANRAQSASVVFTDSVFQGGWGVVAENLGHLADFASGELPALAWLAGAVAVLAWGARGTAHPHGWPWRAFFVAVWTLPALLFYTFVYVGWPIFPSGYLMVVLPGACVGLATLMVTLAGRVLPRPAVLAVALALMLCAGIALAAAWPKAVEPTREADAWAESWEGFEQEFPPDETLLVTFGSWFPLKVHHPEYTVYVITLFDDLEGRQRREILVSQGRHDEPRYFDLVQSQPGVWPLHPIPPWAKRVLVHEGFPAAAVVEDDMVLFREDVAMQDATLPSGRQVRWFEADPGRPIEAFLDDVGSPVDPADMADDMADGEAGPANPDGRAAG